MVLVLHLFWKGTVGVSGTSFLWAGCLSWMGWWRWALVSPMEWRPAGLSVCLPLLIFPVTIQSRSSLLAPAHSGGPRKRAVKWLWFAAVDAFPVTYPTVWPGGIMVSTLDSQLKGSQFDSRLFCFQATTLGKLFTHMYLCHQTA